MPSAPAKYTEQLIVMVTPETKAHIRAVAKEEGASLSEVCRVYLSAGVELGGGMEDVTPAPATVRKSKKRAGAAL